LNSEAVKKSKILKISFGKLLITNECILRFRAFCQFFHSFSGRAGRVRPARHKTATPPLPAPRLFGVIVSVNTHPLAGQLNKPDNAFDDSGCSLIIDALSIKRRIPSLYAAA
jgi:hypothetical protein